MFKKALKSLLLILVSVILIVVILNIAFPVYIYWKQDPQKLYAAIEKANLIVITDNNDDSNVIYQSKNLDDLNSLRTSLKVNKQVEYSFPACRGSLGINFYNDDERVARIAYLDDHIRVDKIEDIGYIALADKTVLQEWLRKRNLPIEHHHK